MKKNIIIAAIAAASALLLSVSCQKENQPESQSGINGGANTFTATIEQGLTKTTITSEYDVNWKTNDKININGVTFKATPDGTDATKATFAKDPNTQDDPTGETFKAIYPSTLYVTDHFALPATQTYTAGEFNAPMYAESETTTLSFKNICAVLAIKVTSADINALKSIKVKSDKKLNGTFTVASTTDGYKAVIRTDGSNEVVLSMGETPIDPTTDGITFYIAIPAQEYSYLKIYLSEDGTLYKRAMITKKAAGLGTIDCNKIYNIAYETNAIQMYADGPYWSTMNLGATAVTGTDSYGTYFAWGDVTGQEASTKTGTSPIANAFTTGFSWNNCPFAVGGTYKFNKYVPSEETGYLASGFSGDERITLELADDAANKNWGGSWRMPTSAEFQALKAATYWKWEDGGYYVYAPQSGDAGKTSSDSGVTGTYNKSAALLFFPAAGSGDGTSLNYAGSNGSYWSSSLYPSIPTNAYRLDFNSGGVDPQNSIYRYYGFSVRPVSD